MSDLTDVRVTRAAPSLREQGELLVERFARVQRDKLERWLGAEEPVAAAPSRDVVLLMWRELEEARERLAEKDASLAVAGDLLAESIQMIDRYRAALEECGVTIDEGKVA